MADKQNQKKKIILNYAVGIGVLFFCVAAAWFFPEAYGKWNDNRMLKKVYLSEREQIDFLDSNSLKVLERWAHLNDVENLNEIYAMRNGMLQVQAEKNSAVIQKNAEKALKRFAENEIFPIEWKDEYTYNMQLILLEERDVYLGEENETIPVTISRYYITTASGNDLVASVVMDMQTQVIYYIAMTGSVVEEGMAKELGFSSVAQMVQEIIDKDTFPKSFPQIPVEKFADACEADSASEYLLEEESQTVKLHFEKQDVWAKRQLVMNNNGHYGIGIWLWSSKWMELNQRGVLSAEREWYPEEYIEDGAYDYIYQEAEWGIFLEEWLDMLLAQHFQKVNEAKINS